jgi:shikimate dehydrogenase
LVDPPGAEAAAGAGAARIRGGTRTLGIIGWPVENSLSPAIHNAAFSAMSMRWVYVPLPVEPGHLGDALKGLVSLGFSGANVTMPHKTQSAELADTLSEDASRLGAVNTFVIQAGRLHGHDTDAPGFDRFLRWDAGFDPQDRSALLFGAGGAARACALALARGGLANLTVAVRDPARAEALLIAVDGFPLQVAVVALADAPSAQADLIVNATPLGTSGEALPLPELDPSVLVVDLLYHPATTPLQSAAKAAGALAFGGLGLLLHQAALSFELWTGQQPPLPVMSAVALAELAERA